MQELPCEGEFLRAHQAGADPNIRRFIVPDKQSWRAERDCRPNPCPVLTRLRHTGNWASYLRPVPGPRVSRTNDHKSQQHDNEYEFDHGMSLFFFEQTLQESICSGQHSNG